VKYSKFKDSKPLSRISFGAMGLNAAFGNFDEKELIRSIHHSLEKGINVIDTARAYGDSEKILGAALKAWPDERPFIASKVLTIGDEKNNGWGIPNAAEVAYPRGKIRESVETSLKTLGLEQIDLMQLHQYWGHYLYAEHWLEELNALKKEGKINYIGVSLVDHHQDAGIAIAQSGLIDSIQTIINIFDPIAFDSLVPVCEKNDVFIMARCVLDEGGLTGFLNMNTTFDTGDFRADYFDHGPRAEYIRRVKRLHKFIPQHASSLAELAIRFVLTLTGVSTANISMHIPKFADENIQSMEKGPLSSEVFEDIRKHHRWLHNVYGGKYFPEDESEQVGVTGFKETDEVKTKSFEEDYNSYHG